MLSPANSSKTPNTKLLTCVCVCVCNKLPMAYTSYLLKPHNSPLSINQMKTSKGKGQKPKLSNPISQLPDHSKNQQKSNHITKTSFPIYQKIKTFPILQRRESYRNHARKPQYLLYPNLQTKKAYPKIPTYKKPTFLYFQIYKQKQRCNKKTINQEPKSFQLC